MCGPSQNIPPAPNLSRLTRLLAFASTVRWRDTANLGPRTAERLKSLAEAGWLIREAGARNFIVWRPYVRRGDVYGLIVLPLDAQLDAGERTALAIDLLCSALAADDPLFLLDEIGGRSGFARRFRSAGWKVQTALAPTWPHSWAPTPLPDWFLNLAGGGQ